MLFGVEWCNSAGPDETDPSVLSPAHALPALSMVFVSSRDSQYRRPVDDMLLWLSTTPTRYHLKELSVGLCNISATLRLVTDTSLAVLRVRMDDDGLLSK